MLESVLNIFKRTKNSNNIENKNLKFLAVTINIY